MIRAVRQLGVLALLVAGLLIADSDRAPVFPLGSQDQKPYVTRPGTPSIRQAGGTETLSIAVVGDSLSTGYGTSPSLAWPRLLADDTATTCPELEVTNDAKNGSGYLSDGDGGETFASEVAETVGLQTRLVLFFGSENDMGYDDVALREAAAATYAQARAQSPDALIVVVGPPSYTGTPEPELLQVRDQDRAAALEAGVTFVDPITDGWISGDAGQLIGPDGDHPSEAGQYYLRTKMEGVVISALKGAGLLPEACGTHITPQT